MQATMNSFKSINIGSFKGYDRVNQEHERLQHRRRTRKRIAIISVSSLILVLIIVGAIVASRGSGRKEESDAPPASTMSRMDTIKAVCNVTRYPTYCISSLSSAVDSGSIDPQQLFRVSLQVAFREVSNFSDLPAKINATVMDEKVRQAMEDCQEMIEDAMDDLNKSILITPQGSETKNILPRTKVEDLKTWLSSVLSNMDSCLDGFSNTTGGFRERMEFALSNSTKFTSNSLAIVNKIFSLLQDVDIPINRRLLAFPSSDSVAISDFPAWVKSKDRKLLQEVSAGIKPDVVVSQDGSGTVSSVKEAIDMVPIKSTKRFIISVKKGKYVENILIDKKKQNVMIIGEGMDQTIISGNLNVIDGMRTFSSATFAVTGSGFIAKDIGFENTAGAVKEQAVAARVGSDHSVFYRCKFDGYQDTLYVHSNRQFYKECTISGTIDFIFGNAAVVFQRCTIIARQPLSSQKNTVTAQGRTDPNQNTGISIHDCEILAERSGVTAPTYLGRPWKPYCVTVIMKTNINSIVQAAGWLSWDGSNNPPPYTIFYGEYQNTGPGAGTKNRVTWKGYYPVLTDSVAEKYTVESFIAGNQWLPETGVTYSLGL